jgi:hypothetical protein
MSTRSAGAELEQAQAAYGRAFNRLGLGRRSDTESALGEAQTAIGHLRAACPDAKHPGAVFLAARIADTGALLGRLQSAGDVARIDVVTGLLAIDFLLRALQAQCDSHAAPVECINCHSTHLVPHDGGTADAPLYHCTDCGLTAAYPAG